jgi:hypothetical protein
LRNFKLSLIKIMAAHFAGDRKKSALCFSYIITSTSVFQSASVAGRTVIKYQPCGKPRTFSSKFHRAV